MDELKVYQRNAATAGVLMEAGIVLMRQNLRRRYPSATGSEIDGLLQDWLCRRNEPLPGDTAGAVRIRQKKT